MPHIDDDFLKKLGMSKEEFLELRRRNRRMAIIWLVVAITIVAGACMVAQVNESVAMILGVIGLGILFPCFAELLGW